MRSNKELNPRFITSQRWTHDRGPGGELKNLIPNEEGSENPYTAFSHSGKERNRFFLNNNGQSFSNLSGISGADSIFDGRTFVHWDFNRDGRPDIAVVNANKRLLQIFENQNQSNNHFLALQLQGDSKNKSENGRSSNRDAIGATVTLQVGGQTLIRVLSCGEGFASQNSRTLLIGIGPHEEIDSIKIDWPSGKQSTIGKIDAGKTLSVSEDDDSVAIENYHLD